MIPKKEVKRKIKKCKLKNINKIDIKININKPTSGKSRGTTFFMKSKKPILSRGKNVMTMSPIRSIICPK